MTGPMRLIITGGAGFIGSALIRQLISETDAIVLNIDKLTYAASPAALSSVANTDRYGFLQADIGDRKTIDEAFRQHRPDAIIHLAAETHVDRSIDGPAAFVGTNVVGTYSLLEVALAYWEELPGDNQRRFRFHHVSTDEVFGSLGASGRFSEATPYSPSSPYSASKAAADHLVRAWHATYGLPVVITNCSNNYGPYQFPEKLIPLAIIKGLREERIPVYGRGHQVRDWLHVDDHAAALRLVLDRGKIGDSYNIGGRCERTNLTVVQQICDILDRLHPRDSGRTHRELIAFVADRPGHDLRYAMDTSKIETELGWSSRVEFDQGLESTVRWYLENRSWWQDDRRTGYAGERLGLAKRD